MNFGGMQSLAGPPSALGGDEGSQRGRLCQVPEVCLPLEDGGAQEGGCSIGLGAWISLGGTLAGYAARQPCHVAFRRHLCASAAPGCWRLPGAQRP